MPAAQQAVDGLACIAKRVGQCLLRKLRGTRSRFAMRSDAQCALAEPPRDGAMHADVPAVGANGVDGFDQQIEAAVTFTKTLRHGRRRSSQPLLTRRPEPAA